MVFSAGLGGEVGLALGAIFQFLAEIDSVIFGAHFSYDLVIILEQAAAIKAADNMSIRDFIRIS